MILIYCWAFFSLWLVLIRYGLGVRVAFLAAQVVHAILIVLATEGLSAFQALTLWPLATFWSAVLLVNVTLLRSRTRSAVIPSRVPFDALEMVILAVISVIVLVTGIIALVAPPNNSDVMTYHMPRVAHWAYNGTVANYPTNILRQLVIQPYGEYAVLQTYILNGSDSFVNLVQWNSMVASLAGVSLIAGLLGASRRVQLFAVLFAATLPMGILQASDALTDHVTTLWVVCVAVFALFFIRTEEPRWGILCALSLGVASLTKGTAVISGLPFLVWALWRVRWRGRHKIALAIFTVVGALALNACFLHRLLQLSDNPFKVMGASGSAVVNSVDIRGAISTAVRGMATELASHSAAWNTLLLKVVEGVHSWLGIASNDPHFSTGEKFFLLYGPCIEDHATSFWHSLFYLLVAMGCLAVLVVRLFFRKGRLVISPERGSGGIKDAQVSNSGDLLCPFAGVFFIAVFLFCCLVKWHLWIARFHLPFFVLFSAVAAVWVGSRLRREWLLWVAGGLMCAGAILPLFYNYQRPLFPCGAVTRNEMERRVSRGGEIFDWLMQNGYFEEGGGDRGYLRVVTEKSQKHLQQAYPAEYPQVWSVLMASPSFDRNIFLASREELLFGRLGKISRDALVGNLEFVKRQLRAAPECPTVGFMFGISEYEYPFWNLSNSAGRPVPVEHVMVDNISAHVSYPRGEPDPCLILKEGGDGPDILTYHGRTYGRKTGGPMQVYVADQNGGAR